MKLISLTQVHTKKQIYLNKDQILFMEEVKPYVKIYLGCDSGYIIVTESIRDILILCSP